MQFPNKKTNIALIIKSKYYNSVKKFIDWIGNCVLDPNYYTSINDLSDICNKNNYLLRCKLLVNIKSCTYNDKDKYLYTLKNIVTNKELIITKKDWKPIKYNNTINYIFTVGRNSKIENNIDHKYYHCITSKARLFCSNNNYFDNEDDTFTKDPYYAQNLYRYLMKRDISNFDIQSIHNIKLE